MLYVFIPYGVFLPCGHGLDFYIKIICENPTNQKCKNRLLHALHRYSNTVDEMNTPETGTVQYTYSRLG